MYRFAASLTGDMHIDNLRVALFNYICAKQNKDKFLIHIKDIDKERMIEGKDQEILQILALFGIQYDQIMYQSEGLKFHRQFASKLLMDQKAFSCFCTPEMIQEKQEHAKNSKVTYHYDGTCKTLTDAEVLNNESPFVIRIRKPDSDVTFKDLIKGELTFSPDTIDDFVIMKVDKTPTYNFACAIDDMMSDISTVIEEENHVSNAPRQTIIRKYLGYDKEIHYAHFPSIRNDSAEIMSQNDDTSNVKWLLEQGFLPSAITNYLILIGNKTPSEIFSLDEALAWFDLDKVSKTPAKFDITKLRQLNREHIRMLDPKELGKYLGYSSEDIGKLAKVYTEEASTINELKSKIDKIFAAKTGEEFPEEFKILKDIACNAPYFKDFNDYKTYLGSESGLKGKELLKPLQIMMTGVAHGPNLSDIYPYIKNYLGEIIK